MAERNLAELSQRFAGDSSQSEWPGQVIDLQNAATKILKERSLKERSLHVLPTQRFSHPETIPGVGEVTRAYFMNRLLIGYKCGWTIRQSNGNEITRHFRLESDGSVTLLGPSGDNMDSRSIFRADGAIKFGEDRMSEHESAQLLREIAFVTGTYLGAKSFIKERAYEVLEPAQHIEGAMETTRRIKKGTPPLSFSSIKIKQIVGESHWRGEISRLYTSSESPKIHVKLKGNKGETLGADIDLIERRTEMTLDGATFSSDGTGTASELMSDEKIEDAWRLLRAILEKTSGATPEEEIIATL